MIFTYEYLLSFTKSQYNLLISITKPPFALLMLLPFMAGLEWIYEGI